MNTTISMAVSGKERLHAKRMAKLRGHRSLSAYIRSLINEDDEEWVITEQELLRRSREADTLARSGKLLKAKSLEDLLS